mgnify:CR=1 FL=1
MGFAESAEHHYDEARTRLRHAKGRPELMSSTDLIMMAQVEATLAVAMLIDSLIITIERHDNLGRDIEIMADSLGRLARNA